MYLNAAFRLVSRTCLPAFQSQDQNALYLTSTSLSVLLNDYNQLYGMYDFLSDITI